MMTVDTFYEAMHTFLKPRSSSPSGIIITTDHHSQLQKASPQMHSVVTFTSCSSPRPFLQKVKKETNKQSFSQNERTSKFSQPTAASKIKLRESSILSYQLHGLKRRLQG